MRCRQYKDNEIYLYLNNNISKIKYNYDLIKIFNEWNWIVGLNSYFKFVSMIIKKIESV